MHNLSGAKYDMFKKTSSLRINNKQTVAPGDAIDNVVPGDVTLVSTVPADYTQSTTCTHTSSGTPTSCAAACTLTTCTFKVSSAKDGDEMSVKIILDGLKDSRSYGYTVNVKSKIKL